MAENPQTHYATGPDGVALAYQVVGDGPLDLLWVPGWISHVEAAWDEPTLAYFFRRLASFSRLILFDKRGTGLSDHVPLTELPTLEQRMTDILTVCDAVGATRPALLGVSEGAPLCILFAATYPQRTNAIILVGGFARETAAPDYPWGRTQAEHEAGAQEILANWGGPVGLAIRAPTKIGDERFRETWARYLRLGASPSAVLALNAMNAGIDVRPILPSVRVPTLVIHRLGDLAVKVSCGRHLAERIAAAKYVELPGEDHLPWVGDADAILDEIEEFLTGVRPAPEPDRVLATVLFTDIVGSTQRAAAMGDAKWAELLDAHHAAIRHQLERFGGREIGTAGDGFLATFQGPARAIRCALACIAAVGQLGLQIRAGIHTGEVERAGDDVRGLAVHIGARIGSLAGASEVLVSRTVKDLVVGSGLVFSQFGRHALKGVPDEWELFAVEG